MQIFCITESLKLFIIGNSRFAPDCNAKARFWVRASTLSGVSSPHHFGLNVAMATPRAISLSFVVSRCPGGLDASGTPARPRAPDSPPPPVFCVPGGTSGPGGGGSVRGLRGGGSSDSGSSFFSSPLLSEVVLFSCSLRVLLDDDMMMNKKTFRG
jgi:hypothetical protein